QDQGGVVRLDEGEGLAAAGRGHGAEAVALLEDGAGEAAVDGVVVHDDDGGMVAQPGHGGHSGTSRQTPPQTSEHDNEEGPQYPPPSSRSFSVSRVKPSFSSVAAAVSWSSTCSASAERPCGPTSSG